MEPMPLSPDTEAVAPSVADDPALGLSRRTKFEILFAILLGLFLSALDQTIVGPVLPRIVTELHGQDLYTWVVTIFLLTSTVSVPVSMFDPELSWRLADSGIEPTAATSPPCSRAMKYLPFEPGGITSSNSQPNRPA